MKKLLALLAFVSLPALAQAPVAVQGNAPAFDYKIVDLTSFAVTRFELQIDTGAFVSIGIPATTDDAQTQVGAHTYAGPKFGTLGLSVGAHTFTSRACNTAAGCGFASPPFSFTYAPIPNATVNPRLQ